MTNQEAIETIKVAISEVEWNYPMEYAVAFEKAIEALEKQIPKKIYRDNDNGVYEKEFCPSCNKRLFSDEKYCSRCGQALDWGDGK